MYLVYLTSHLDRSSIEFWLHINKYDEDYLIIDNRDDLENQLLVEPCDVIVFDYKYDIALIDTLRQLSGMYESLYVFAENSQIGQAYLPVTENIWVLPKSLNLMVYLWQHPAFTLGNVINAEENNKDVFSIDKFADIDTEKEVLEFRTTIEDVGDSDLASIKMLKVEKSNLGDTEPSYTEYDEEEYIPESRLPTGALKGLLKKHPIAVAIEESTTIALESINESISEIKEPEHKEEDVPEETAEYSGNSSYITEATSEFTEDLSYTSEESNNNNTVAHEDAPDETVEESVVESEGITDKYDASFKSVEKVPEQFEEIEDTTENRHKLKELMAMVDSNLNQINIPVPKEDNTPEISPDEKVIYERFDESKADTYDEVQTYKKHISDNTEITVENSDDMYDSLRKSTTSTGVVDVSDGVSENTEWHIRPEDMPIYNSKYGETESDSHEEIVTTETYQKKEPRVLKGHQTYTASTEQSVKKVGIKIVDVESDMPVRRGTLAGLRKRNMKTYKTAYEYFDDKYKYDISFIQKLNTVNDYVVQESRKGSNIFLEEELYKRGIIDDDIYIKFMKEYLHRSVLTLEELMRADVILDEFDESTCRKLRILQIPPQDPENICVVVSNISVSSVLGTLRSKYEKLELYVTLDKYIDIRLE